LGWAFCDPNSVDFFKEACSCRRIGRFVHGFGSTGLSVS
jgi:hypothetical protein